MCNAEFKPAACIASVVTVAGGVTAAAALALPLAGDASVCFACSVFLIHAGLDWSMLAIEAALLALTVWATFRIRLVAVRAWLVPLLVFVAILLAALAVVHSWLSRTSLLTSRVKAKHGAAAAGYALLTAVNLLLVVVLPYFPTRWQHRKMERQAKEGKQPSNKS
ncbi:MAG: hypothetical protein J3K34DRAFT_44954 [Monoraphidium minutum]|nr:MAG: hypothetical protein J3K34DRAFT_44954 [Monoraphidium minutum]